jgi:putative DNA methylase
VALTTFSDLVLEARDRAIEDAKKAGWPDDGIGLNNGGTGATAYGDAVAVYLAFAVDKVTDYWSSLCSWHSSRETMRNTFGRQAIPMVWDYAEANPFCSSSGNWMAMVNWTWKSLAQTPAEGFGGSTQSDAANYQCETKLLISTDPPYYDNIGYADLSDFFYVWLRRSLKDIFPDIFATMLVPKEPELVATPYRHGNKEKAERFFLEGMSRAIRNMAQNGHPAFPVTIYYAFKQSETKTKGTASTGWETFLEAVKEAGFAVTGTWPMRTELSNRMVGSGTNALASSIVLVCRRRPDDAPTISRKQFLRELDDTLPEALEEMIGGSEGVSPIAPVDLAQAAIGPGMAVFSRYEAVLEADGPPMSVHNALILINKAIDEYFSQAESDMDSDTRFCVAWFLQYGFAAGQFGEADVLARAKGTTVDGVQQAGVVESGMGRVRLLRLDEYPAEWDPKIDKRVPVWAACHQLCRALRASETEAGRLLARMPDKGEPVRQLAYRLYTQCERKGWAEEARSYNELITAWPAILDEARRIGESGKQMELFT